MPTKHTLDAGLGFWGILSPWWSTTIEPVIQGFVLIGGAILIFLRIMVAWRDYKQKRD